MITANPVLFKLGHGDMVTIQWSGEPRLVVADVREDGTWLRDLTSDEAREFDEAMDAAYLDHHDPEDQEAGR
jgi:hypothetical protein